MKPKQPINAGESPGFHPVCPQCVEIEMLTYKDQGIPVDLVQHILDILDKSDEEIARHYREGK